MKKFPDNFLSIEYSLGQIAGIPDLLYLHPDRPVAFVELKQHSTAKVQPSQKIMFRHLKSLNKPVFIIHWARNFKDIVVKDVINEVKFEVKLSDAVEKLNELIIGSGDRT